MRPNRLTHALILLLSLLLWVGSEARGAELPDSVEVLPDSIEALPLDSTVIELADSLLRNDSTLVGDSLTMTLDLSKLRPNRKDGFVPDPIRAMWIGIVFPGGGQIYNRKFWKLPVFYGGFLGCMYALTWNNMMLRDYSQAYLDIMDDDPETKSYEQMLPLGYSIEGKEDRFKTIFKNKKDRYRKFRDLSVFAFIGVYALSIVDAYVDAELSTFDISRDLSLHFEPAVFGTSLSRTLADNRKAYGIQMNLTF
ncbi:MAG: DUF5683 domain-containing protein [Prevotellaceae bacterium]|nr:DUF5683 domain-containing protein [Prevotellaceae bacterium]